MANIKNMRMWDTIRKDNRIVTNSSWLGLRTTAFYAPTHSVIEARKIEYTPSDGERLLHILTSQRDVMLQSLSKFSAQPTVNGNYMLDLCRSRDGSFAAIQLLQFRQMIYEPVTVLFILDGIEAEAVANIAAQG